MTVLVAVRAIFQTGMKTQKAERLKQTKVSRYYISKIIIFHITHKYTFLYYI